MEADGGHGGMISVFETSSRCSHTSRWCHPAGLADRSIYVRGSENTHARYKDIVSTNISARFLVGMCGEVHSSGWSTIRWVERAVIPDIAGIFQALVRGKGQGLEVETDRATASYQLTFPPDV